MALDELLDFLDRPCVMTVGLRFRQKRNISRVITRQKLDGLGRGRPFEKLADGFQSGVGRIDAFLAIAQQLDLVLRDVVGQCRKAGGGRLALFAMYYNFVRIHKTLKVTPAMAAKVTERLWEMGDIVDVLEAWETQNS